MEGSAASSVPEPRPRLFWLPWAVVALGVLLRLLPIEYGKPAPGYYSSDEIDSVSRALMMAEGDLLPLHANKPTLYIVNVAAGLGARYAWLRVTRGTTVGEYAEMFVLEPFPFYRIARLATILASIGTLIALAFFLRRRPPWLAALAVGVLAVAPSSIYYGHVAKEDAHAAFFAFLALGFAWMVWSADRFEGRRPLALLFASAAAAGFAFSSKYNCFFAPLFCGFVWMTIPELRRRLWLPFALAGAFFVAFFIGTPYALLNPASFIERTLASPIASQVAGTHNIVGYMENRGPVFLSRILLLEWSFLVLPLVAGTVLFARRSGWRSWALIAPVALYLLVLLFSGQLDFQYVLPLTPALALFAAEGFRLATTAGARAIPFGRTLVAIAVVGLLWNGALSAGRMARSMGTDTRLEAAVFLEEYLAEHPELRELPILCVTAYYYRYYPAFDVDAASYERLLEETRAQGGSGAYFELAGRVARETPEGRLPARFLHIRSGFTVTADGTRLFQEQPFPLEWEHYAGRYGVIVVPHYTWAYLDRPEEAFASFRELLLRMREQEEIAVFERQRPWTSEPTLHLFRMRDDATAE